MLISMSNNLTCKPLETNGNFQKNFWCTAVESYPSEESGLRRDSVKGQCSLQTEGEWQPAQASGPRCSFWFKRRKNKVLKKDVFRNFPSGWGSNCQCRGTRVWPLVWEDSTFPNYWAHVPQLRKPVSLEPVLCDKRRHRSEKPAHHSEERPRWAATREAHAQQ